MPEYSDDACEMKTWNAYSEMTVISKILIISRLLPTNSPSFHIQVDLNLDLTRKPSGQCEQEYSLPTEKGESQTSDALKPEPLI